MSPSRRVRPGTGSPNTSPGSAGAPTSPAGSQATARAPWRKRVVEEVAGRGRAPRRRRGTARRARPRRCAWRCPPRRAAGRVARPGNRRRSSMSGSAACHHGLLAAVNGRGGRAAGGRHAVRRDREDAHGALDDLREHRCRDVAAVVRAGARLIDDHHDREPRARHRRDAGEHGRVTFLGVAADVELARGAGLARHPVAGAPPRACRCLRGRRRARASRRRRGHSPARSPCGRSAGGPPAAATPAA